MTRKVVLIVSFMVFAAFLAAPVLSGPGKGRHRGRAGKSNTAHLYLYEKSGEPDWFIVEDGAWGKMKYNMSGSSLKFVFNGHGLLPDEDFTLMYYPNPWPGEGLICLGEGAADEDGNVHIKGNADTGDLPVEGDENAGAKIWLVLSGDVDCEGDDVNPPRMIGWTWEEYLFEHNLMTFDDTDE